LVFGKCMSKNGMTIWRVDQNSLEMASVTPPHLSKKIEQGYNHALSLKHLVLLLKSIYNFKYILFNYRNYILQLKISLSWDFFYCITLYIHIGIQMTKWKVLYNYFAISWN
jgi:hypothetical protein